MTSGPFGDKDPNLTNVQLEHKALRVGKGQCLMRELFWEQ